MKFFVGLLLLGAAMAADMMEEEDPCGEYFEMVAGHCMMASMEPKNYTAAVADCEEYDSTLVENRFAELKGEINQFASDEFDYMPYWIGAKDNKYNSDGATVPEDLIHESSAGGDNFVIAGGEVLREEAAAENNYICVRSYGGGAEENCIQAVVKVSVYSDPTDLTTVHDAAGTGAKLAFSIDGMDGLNEYEVTADPDDAAVFPAERTFFLTNIPAIVDSVQFAYEHTDGKGLYTYVLPTEPQTTEDAVQMIINVGTSTQVFFQDASGALEAATLVKHPDADDITLADHAADFSGLNGNFIIRTGDADPHKSYDGYRLFIQKPATEAPIEVLAEPGLPEGGQFWAAGLKHGGADGVYTLVTETFGFTQYTTYDDVFFEEE